MITIHRDVEQGSREWWDLRIGRPTASRFHRIITRKTLKVASAINGFAAELLAEQLLGKPLDEVELDSIWAAHGSEEEDRARRWYAMYREVEIEQVGFVDMEFGPYKVGASPDGLVGEDGGVEIKCRGAKNHMASVMGLGEIADNLQVQGNLWVTRRDWWDVVAYNQHLPKRIERHYPDPKVQVALTEGVDELFELIEKGRAQLEQYGDVIDVDTKLLAELKTSLAQQEA